MNRGAASILGGSVWHTFAPGPEDLWNGLSARPPILHRRHNRRRPSCAEAVLSLAGHRDPSVKAHKAAVKKMEARNLLKRRSSRGLSGVDPVRGVCWRISRRGCWEGDGTLGWSSSWVPIASFDAFSGFASIPAAPKRVQGG